MFPRIIVVEDDDLLRPLMARLIMRVFPSAEIVEFASAEELLRAGFVSCDLMILDCKLLGMDGPALLAALRSLGLSSPVVLTSGLPHFRAEAELAGADRFILKPDLLEELPHELRRLLSPRCI